MSYQASSIPYGFTTRFAVASRRSSGLLIAAVEQLMHLLMTETRPGLCSSGEVGDFQVPHCPELQVTSQQRIERPGVAINAGQRARTVFADADGIFFRARTTRRELTGVVSAGPEKNLITRLKHLPIHTLQTPPRFRG